MKLQLHKYSYLILGLIVVLVTVIFFDFTPRHLEQSRNRIDKSDSRPLVPASNQTFHQSLLIADLHADSLLWDRDSSKKSEYGHLDIPRLIEGNVAIQVFSIVTKVPHGLNIVQNNSASDSITYLALAQAWPPKTWGSLFERAMYQADKLQQVERKIPSQFQIIKNKMELQNFLTQRKKHPNITSGILSLEGAHALEEDVNNLDRLYAAGFRIIGFSHFFDNNLGGSAHGVKKDGLSEFGLKVFKRAEKLGLLVDVSHASPQLAADIIDLSMRPILATHTDIDTICPSAQRNLTDNQVIKIAGTGGLIGIGFWPTASCSENESGIVKSIKYVIDLVGEDYVALGSDFDGNVQVPFAANNMVLLTSALIEAGFSNSQIQKIMGGNILRLLENNLPNN